MSHGTFLRTKQTVTVAIVFLNWLQGRGCPLGEFRKEHLDAWLADGPSTRRFVDRIHTLDELTRLRSAPSIVDAPGPHRSTIGRHAIGAATMYSQYVAVRRDMTLES